jgi:tau tubulin kinase
MLNGTNLIKGRWKIIKAIGAGAFGEIYAGKSIITSELVAIKVEKADSKKQVLKSEVAALKKLQACPNVCRFITCGRYNEYNYLVMELLGDNLSELRRKTATGKFSLATTLMLGVVFVRSLEQIHDLGYLHRDVKPSNFVVGNEGRRNQVFVIDFGLARKFVMPDGSIRPARDQAGFRGTARYASINSHMSRDLGRRDDLWSVLYILIEFAKGYLPWRKLKEKDEIRDVKINMNTPELCDELPKEFLQFMDHLQALDYADRPDYDYLVQLMQHRLKLLGFDDHTPYDWESTSSTGNGLNSSAIGSSLAGASSSPDLARPDSAGRPVISTDAGAPEDPDTPVIYKLVAGGRRAQPASSSNAAAGGDDDQMPRIGGGSASGGYNAAADDELDRFASGPAKPLTDSAEDGRGGGGGGADGSSDLGSDLSDSERPRPSHTAKTSSNAKSTSAMAASSSHHDPKDSSRRSSIEVPASTSKDLELDVINNKPTPNGGSNTTRRQPPAHSTEKCKCTIL